MITIDPKIKCKKVTGKAFRLVYGGKKFITLIGGTSKSKTWTKHSVEEWSIKQEVLNRIKALGLEYEPIDELGLDYKLEEALVK